MGVERAASSSVRRWLLAVLIGVCVVVAAIMGYSALVTYYQDATQNLN